MLGKIAPYEEELRVSMRVRGPGVPAGKTLDHLVGNIDLAPTWAELAGAKAADFCDGRSIVALLRDNPPALNQWRQAFSLEWGPDSLNELSATALPAAQKANLAIPYFRGVRLQTLSYVEYRTGEIELYDIKNDPYELTNLAPSADPKLLTELAARVKELATCKAATCRTAEDAPFNLP